MRLGYWNYSFSLLGSVCDFSYSHVSLWTLVSCIYHIDVKNCKYPLGGLFLWWVYIIFSCLFGLVLVWSLFYWLHWLVFLDLFAWNIFSSFYPELMSIFDVKVYFLDAAKGTVLFLLLLLLLFNLVCSSVSLLGELKPLMLRVINEQCLLIPAILLWYGLGSVSLYLLFWDFIFLMLSSVWLTSSGWKFF